jgi:hypothetical protein
MEKQLAALEEVQAKLIAEQAADVAAEKAEAAAEVRCTR